MILSDSAIQAAIRSRIISIDPEPPLEHYNATGVDLRLGHKLKVWNKGLFSVKGTTVKVSYDDVKVPDLLEYTQDAQLEKDGSFILAPKEFVLGQTLEKLKFPLGNGLAGRIEGRSSLARLGVVVHLTAPTIHADFGGENGSPLTLEIINLGPFHIQVIPGTSRFCQLIVERVEGEPGGAPPSQFRDQKDPLGGQK